MSVTVLITCFNEGAYIAQALESVLAQTAVDQISAIHICDDGSGLQSREALAALKDRDRRLSIHWFENAGVAINRNRGVSLATTDFIAFLDGDDYWVADKLERQLQLLRDNPSCGLVYSGYFAFLDGQPDKQWSIRVGDLARFSDQPRGYFLNDPPIFPSSVLLRRAAFEALDEGFVKDCTPFEDFDLFFRISRLFGIRALVDPLFHKRYRAGSLSSRSIGLMMRHALVAFRAAQFEPRLLPNAPGRIGERARRLAMVYLYSGDWANARRLAWAAVSMNSWRPKFWVTLGLALGGSLSLSVLRFAFSSKIKPHLY